MGQSHAGWGMHASICLWVCTHQVALPGAVGQRSVLLVRHCLPHVLCVPCPGPPPPKAVCCGPLVVQYCTTGYSARCCKIAVGCPPGHNGCKFARVVLPQHVARLAQARYRQICIAGQPLDFILVLLPVSVMLLMLHCLQALLSSCLLAPPSASAAQPTRQQDWTHGEVEQTQYPCL
jgi:hypothetical protein